MIIEQAIEVLKTEAQGILSLTDRIDENFSKMVELICSSDGRVIVSGIGKSGIIGKKISATLNSTGTMSMFLHPVEAMHGDLGMVCANDILLAISNSGETHELNMLLCNIKKVGCKIIAFTGNIRSTLAQQSNIVIDTMVKKEACPMGLAPTTSTTAQLAMGDALAVVLINKKKFRTGDFKKNHPGGLLGQRLSKKVKDFMFTGKAIPNISEDASMEDALREIDRVQLGTTFVLKSDNKLAGIITDGDIRRCIVQKKSVLDQNIQNIMTKNPRTIGQNAPAYDALNLMEEHQITILPIIDQNEKIQGILHLHDILGKGEFKFTGSQASS